MKTNIKNIIALFILFLSSQSLFAQPGNGDPVDGYPDFPLWYERAAVTLTNSCRIAPTEYRDIYLGKQHKILLAKNYPAVPPVFWNINLSRASRSHAIDMATNCGMQHNSCDGTKPDDRISKFYPQWMSIGENVAFSSYRPQSTIFQWLMDVDRNSVPAPDGQPRGGQWPSGDYHRKVIMTNNWGEVGIGYATGTSIQGRLLPFWAQDFSDVKSKYNDQAIASGSHIYINKNAVRGKNQFDADSVTFIATYYTTPSAAPTQSNVIVNGVTHALTLESGQAGRGTWSFALPKGTTCREYFFRFTSKQGKTFRYPQSGILLTFGEGSCKTDYAAKASVKVIPYTSHEQKIRLLYTPSAQQISLFDLLPSNSTPSIFMSDLTGKRIDFKMIEQGRTHLTIQLHSDLPKGVYLIKGIKDKAVFVKKLFVD